jgi:hypothetical protein
LVEAGVVGADVRDATPILVTHVEDLTMVLCVGVEPDSSIGTVEREGQVRKVLPPLGLEARTVRLMAVVMSQGTAADVATEGIRGVRGARTTNGNLGLHLVGPEGSLPGG